MSDRPKGTEPEKPRKVEVVGAVAMLPVRLERPVKIDPPTADQWTPQTLPVGAAPVQVAGAHPKRARLVLRNTGEEDALLASNRAIVRQQSYVLEPGEELELRHTGEVYALSGAADLEPTELTVSAEYVR